MEAPYYRIYGDYEGEGPVFVGREQAPWLDEFEANWETIRDEFEAHRRRSGLKSAFIPDDVAIQGWSVINFVSYLLWYERTCRSFPRTTELLRSVPRLTTAFLSRLAPRSSLPWHNGDTNTTYRCHLGLTVPGPVDVCGLEAGGERSGWAEGSAFAFNEAWRHRVWNDTDRERVVLVFDVMRPEYWDRRFAISGAVLSAITVTLLETKLPLGPFPPRARSLIHRTLAPPASMLLRAQAQLRRST